MYFISLKESIRLNVHAYAYVGVGTTTKVELRVGNVLSEPVISSDTYYYTKKNFTTNHLKIK